MNQLSVAQTLQKSFAGIVFASLFMLASSASGQVANQNLADNPPATNRAQFRYWTTNWSFREINVGTLLDRLRRVGIDIPVDAAGDATVEFSVSVPLNALRDGSAYRFVGKLSSQQLRLEQLQLINFATDVRYEFGVLSLSNLVTNWRDVQGSRAASSAPGALRGNVSVGVVPRTDVEVSLAASQLSIAPLYDLVVRASQSGNLPTLNGIASGTLAVQAPLSNLRDVNAWSIDADLQAEDLTIADALPLSLDTGPVRVQNGRVSARDIRANSSSNPEVRLLASLSANLQGDRDFEVTVRANDLPLTSVSQLLFLGAEPYVSGQLDIDARGNGRLGSGDLAQAQWDLQGRIASPQLTAFGLQLGVLEHAFAFDSQHLSLTRLNHTAQSHLLERMEANYQITEAEIAVNNLDAAIFGGSLVGSARLARNDAGNHQVQVTWRDIRPQFDASLYLSTSLRISALSSGEIDWKVPASSLNRPATHQGVASITVNPLRLDDTNVGDLSLTLGANHNSLDLQGEGNLFGGSFSVDSQTQVAQNATWMDVAASLPMLFASSQHVDNESHSAPVNRSDRQNEGVSSKTDVGTQTSVRFDGIQLLPLMTRVLPNPRRIDGIASGLIQFATKHRDESAPHTQMQLSLDNLAVDNRILTRRINADLALSPKALLVRSLRGSFAGGQIDALGRIGLQDSAGRLQIRVAAIDASRGLMIFSKDASDLASGRLSAQLTVETGVQIRARGSLEIRDSALSGMPLGSAHAGLTATATPSLSRWSVNLNAIETTVGSGRIYGEASVRSSYARTGAFDLKSQWQARRLDFGRLLDEVGAGSSYAQGNLNGQLTLNGDGVRSAADLTGRFDAELDGTQARAVPGLTAAQAYLGAFSLAGTRFNEGRIRGSIAAGVANVQDFWLLSERVSVTAGGRIQLASGRIDMSAVVSTGNFDLENVAIAAVAEQLALESVVPLAILVRANQALSNRTLYLDVVGPASDPRIRLKPLDTLRREAARFAIRQAASTVLPTGLIGDSVLSKGGDR